jgi:hypothetical protein
MVRTQIQLTEAQAKALKTIAAREGISMAEVIRRALDKAVQAEKLPDREEIKRRAIAAIGCGHADVTDLSTRTDEYFAEALVNDRIR